MVRGWRCAEPRNPARPGIAKRRLSQSPFPFRRASSRPERGLRATPSGFLAQPDTEAGFARHGTSRKCPTRGLRLGPRGTYQATFRGASVSREAGFRVGWRRCIASPRRGHGRMRACTQIRPRPAERGRSPAQPPVSVIGAVAPRTLCALCVLCGFALKWCGTAPFRARANRALHVLHVLHG